MKTEIKVSHVQIPLKSPYEAFLLNIERVLNKLDPDWSKDLATEPEKVRSYLQALAGDTGLMIFDSQEHGQLLKLYGKEEKAIQYTIGNPLTAVEMTRHNIRAGLYAPVRIIIYEDENGQSYVEYDLPSSLFGPYGNEIFVVAKQLDKKLEAVIHQADSLK